MTSLNANQKRIVVLALITLLSTSIVGVVVFSAKSKKQAAQLPPQKIAELEEKEKHHKLSLKELAELTKARGKNQALLPGVFVLYPVAQDADSLDRLLSRYTIIVAQLIDQKSYVDEHERITSWCKFRTLDTIAQAPPLQTFALRTIPGDLLPLAENEFLVPREGGTIAIDGVEIIQHEQAVPDFRTSRKYLLLVSLNPETRIAQMALGPQSVLPIKGDSSLDSREQEHLLQQTLIAHHNGSIEQLRRDLRQ